MHHDVMGGSSQIVELWGKYDAMKEKNVEKVWRLGLLTLSDQRN